MIPQHQERRRAFSRTPTVLFAEQSGDHASSLSSCSEAILAPVALSIEQALAELVKEVAVCDEEIPTTTPISRPETKQQQESPQQRFLLVLSVSGGCDSVALLHATMELLQKKKTANWELDCRVVHFHHRQREKEADLDCQLVQELAQEEYGIPFVLLDWNEEDNGDDASTTPKKFTQDRARQWRRQRLLEYTQSSLLLDSEKTTENSGKKPIGVILTAHHKDDSEESLLLKLLRGVHLLNLSGMEAITSTTTTSENDDCGDGDDNSDKIYILRPWLKQRKADLQNYLLSNQKTWREDASNSSPKYLRNRVRNELIPLLEDLSPNIHKRLENLEQQSYELQQDLEPRILAHLDQQTEVVNCDGTCTKRNSERRQYIWETQEEDLDGKVVSPLVQSQALFRWMQEEAATAVSYETLQRVLNQLGNHPHQLDWSMDLGGKYSLLRKGSRLTIVHPTDDSSFDDVSETRKRREWRWSILGASKENQDEHDDSTENAFLTISIPANLVSSQLHFVETSLSDYAKLPKARKKFCPSWRNTPIKVGQFLRGQKVPLHERDSTPVLYMTTTSSKSTTAAVENEPKHQNDNNVIVAVKVNGAWMVHADYCYKEEYESSSGGGTTRLTLQVRNNK